MSLFCIIVAAIVFASLLTPLAYFALVFIVGAYSAWKEDREARRLENVSRAARSPAAQPPPQPPAAPSPAAQPPYQPAIAPSPVAVPPASPQKITPRLDGWSAFAWMALGVLLTLVGALAFYSAFPQAVTLNRTSDEKAVTESQILDAKESLRPTIDEKAVTQKQVLEGQGFFGAGGEDAAKVVYVVDRSGSMTDSIDFVKYELKHSIAKLDYVWRDGSLRTKEFYVIFYSSDPPVEMPTRGLVHATEDNKQLAYQFIDGVIAQGETDPSKALERAFSCNPEVIYLLSDGEFDRGIIGLVKRLNFRDKVTVHTIGFLYRTGENVLKEIASGNHGNYKFVSEEDVAWRKP